MEIEFVGFNKKQKKEAKKYIQKGLQKLSEKEYSFNFRGKSMSVEAESLESAYGYFYSAYPQVTKAELDEAYCGEEE